VSDVGVVIRTRNAERYLADSIRSVLEQTLAASEIVVVDGDSTDGTLEVLASFGDSIRTVRQRRRGLAGAAQDGVDALTSPIVAFQDADDLWPSSRLEAMASRLVADPSLDGVMGRVEHFISPELPEEETRRFEIPDGPQPGAGLPSLLVRRTAFDRAGEFLDGLSAGEYLEWLDRAARAGVRIEAVETIALRRRVHLWNFTRSPESKRDYIRAVREVMARRRTDQARPSSP
jgi:glycosyltransferase involved in cell wall biosynthesis